MPTQIDRNKALVTELFQKIVRDRDAQAAARLLRDDYIQHSPDMPPGKAGFLKAVPEMHRDFPALTHEIKHLWAEGDYVIVHALYRFTPQDRGTAVVDMFRIQDGLIAEHWDVAQAIPAQAANTNGMF